MAPCSAVLDVLAENPIFNVLDGDFVKRRPITRDQVVKVAPGLSVEPFLVPGKVAPVQRRPHDGGATNSGHWRRKRKYRRTGCDI